MTCQETTCAFAVELPWVRVPRTVGAMTHYLGRALIGVATLATVSFAVSIAAQHDLRLLRGPEWQLAQGPGPARTKPASSIAVDIPLKQDGQVVDAIGASVGSGEQDHPIAKAGAAF
jgi:hypothetical protein